MTKIEFEPCALKYSLTQGVFVVTHDDQFAAVCNSEKVLLEWLDGCSEKDIPKVKIYLAGVDDFDKDEVTYLIYEKLRANYETYEDWSAWFGPDAFMEYWFDEGTRPEFNQDYARRYRRWREINAPVSARIEPVQMQAAE